MDLVSSIRKTGSRGGVNFNWEDVATSTHRENYLGHSLKAPVGRWAKGKDLTWYAKADSSTGTETEQERAARERKEELKRIKEAEEDAIARALGLPITPRNVTGANAVDVSEERGVEGSGNNSAPTSLDTKQLPNDTRQTSTKQRDSGRHHRRSHRSRSRSRERHRDRLPRRRDGHHSHRSRDEKDDRHDHNRRQRSYSPERNDHRHRRSHRREHGRSRSPERAERRRDGKESFRPRSRDGRSRRSRSPQQRKRRSSSDDHRR
ncbi:kinase phosphorylation protein-domain-containing protein [Daldinia bambusicola]|nr:kinase phosphorylation protein-domain-containing protein [Daldinia bambusicola]